MKHHRGIKDTTLLSEGHEPGYVSRMYEWYLGPPGLGWVDTVGPYEHLADDLVAILRSLSYDFDEAAFRATIRRRT